MRLGVTSAIVKLLPSKRDPPSRSRTDLYFTPWFMGSTRKKLQRLFKAPTEVSTPAFAPRDLDRTPREFDPEGLETVPTASLPPSKPPSLRETPNPPHLNTDLTQRSSTSSHVTRHAPETADTPRAQKQTAHTAPWAAAAAFESWKQQRTPEPDVPSRKTPKAPARAATPPNDTTRVSTPEDSSSKAGGVQVSAEQTRHQTLPPGHVRRLDAPEQNNMRALQSFEAWKQREIRQIDSNAKTYTDEEPKPLPSDRVRRRAIQSRQAMLPEHQRAYAVERLDASSIATSSTQASENTALNEATDAPSSAFVQPTPRKEETATLQHSAHEQTQPNTSLSTPSSPARHAIPAAATTASPQTAAERLMWIRAHRETLSDAAIIQELSSLSNTGLRASHEARRLRMLAEALLRQERHTDAYATLEALQQIVPHDAWTLLRLAEACEQHAGTLEAGLRWCDDLLRLHPWLSQAQTLRERIDAKLQRVN